MKVFLAFAILMISMCYTQAAKAYKAADSIIMKLPDSLLAIPADERYNRHGLEIVDGRSENKSALDWHEGLLDIGDYRINLSAFSDFAQEAFFNKLSWPDTIIYVAEISTGRGMGNDTTVLFSRQLTPTQKNRLKQAPKSAGYDDFNQPSGFGNDCPPGDCKHYFIGLSTRNKITQVNNPSDMNKLIPLVKNPYDAWFVLENSSYWPRGKFAKLKDGYLVLMNKKTRDCQIDYADILYHVHENGISEELGRVLTQKTTLCH
jgi:hypothetical protein